MGWYSDLDDELKRLTKERLTREWFEHFGRFLPKEIIVKILTSDTKTLRRWPITK